MSPDGSTKPLPEEKLLKLIREKAARPASSTPAAAGAGGGGGFSAGNAVGGAPGLHWPALAAGGFGAILLIEAVYLAVQLARPLPTVLAVVPARGLDTEPGAGQAAALEVPSLAQSAAPTLFVSPVPDPLTTLAPATQRRGPSDAVKLLSARLTLMGIMAGASPQAIIEDSQTKKTYFVTAGQAVVEGAVVDQVLDSRVILDVDGEKIELTL